MLRKAMMSRKSGIRSAIAVSARASRARASPTISNWRSTADRKTISRSKSAKVLPVVMVAIASAASRASHNRLFGSRFKHGLPRPFDIGFDVGVAHCAGFDQVDRPAEQILKRLFQSHESLERQCVGVSTIELHQEIDIAATGIEVAASGRA